MSRGVDWASAVGAGSPSNTAEHAAQQYIERTHDARVLNMWDESPVGLAPYPGRRARGSEGVHRTHLGAECGVAVEVKGCGD